MGLDIDTELRKFAATHQFDALAKAGVAAYELLKTWGENVDQVGTSNFWENLKSRLETWDLTASKMGKAQLNVILKASGMSANDANKVRKFFNALVPDAWPVAIIVLLGIGSAAAALFKPSIENFGNWVAQLQNKAIRIQLPDIHSLIAYGFRGGKNDWVTEYMGKHGIPNEVQNILETAARPILGLPEIQALHHRWKWPKKKTLEYLHALGYPSTDTSGAKKSTTEFIYQLLRPILPVGDISEMYRRGKLDHGEIEKQLARHGFDTDWQRIYKELTEKLLDVNSLTELYRRSQIGLEEYHNKLSILGYSEPSVNRLKVLAERIPDYYLSRNLWWRGEIDDQAYLDALQNLGYSKDNAEKIKTVSNLIPTQQDLIRMSVRDIFDIDIRKTFGMDDQFPPSILPWAKKIGLNEDVVKMYWASHWILPSPGQGFDMFHRGIIDRPMTERLMKALDYMPFWQGKMIDLSYRLIPRRSLPRLIRNGRLTVPEAALRFRKLGYIKEDALMMANDAADQAAEDLKDSTKAEIVDDYVYENRDMGVMRKRLATIGIAPWAIDIIVAKAERKLVKYKLTLLAREVKIETPKAKELTKGEVLRMFKERMIDRQRAHGLLSGIGFQDFVINYLLAFVEMQRAREKREGIAKQVRKLFDVRLLTETETQTRLTSADYSNPAATELLDVWKLERYTKETLDAADKRQPTRVDLNDWLKKGVITVDSWTLRMQDMNYARNDIARFLLELAIDMG